MVRTRRVLVVDDEAPIATAIGHALERRGHEVTVVNSAEDALRRPQHEVVVSDVELASMDGFQLLARLRERGDPARAVLLSSRPSFESCQRALRLGADDFLAKPFRMTDLVGAVEGLASGPTGAKRSESAQPEAWRRVYGTSSDAPDRAARDLVAHALRCGIGPSARARIGTAVAELVENALVHGYACGPGQIEVEARVETRALSVVVTDRGAGFDPLGVYLLQAPGACEGGLGRASALAENLAIDSGPGRGTTVRIEFCVARSQWGEHNKIDLSDVDFLAPSAARSVLEAMKHASGDRSLHISPAMAVTIGRLLSGPDPRRGLQGALRS